MKNIYHFLIGILIAIISLAVILIIIPLILPISVIATIFGSTILFILTVLYVIGLTFAFVWFLSREEEKPNLKATYSIKQGREIK